MNLVFLDASYLLAMELVNDQHHLRAIAHWASVSISKQTEFITTSFVFSEVVTYLNSRRLHEKAHEVGDRLLASPHVQLHLVDEGLFRLGWQFMKQHDDKTYSLTDCISFVLMHELQVKTAYSFDHHFRQAGFDVEP